MESTGNTGFEIWTEKSSVIAGAWARARSLSTNSAVFGTDALVDIVFLFALKAVQYIPTQSINVACFGHLIPKMFKLNSCIRIALCPRVEPHSPQADTRRCFPGVALAILATKSPTAFWNRPGSGRPSA